MPAVTPDTIIRRCEQIQTTGIEDALLLDTESPGQHFGVERIAKRIWEMLGCPQSAHALCVAIQREYDVDEVLCEHDLVEFLNDLLTQGLIRVIE